MHILSFMIKFFHSFNQKKPYTLNTLFRIKTYLLAGFCFIVCFYSCSDDTNEVGYEIKPPGDEITVFNDSTSVVIPYSVVPDTTELTLNSENMLLGFVNDPNMGTYQSDFFAEVEPRASTVNFDDEAVLDSVVIYLGYSNIYGDTIGKQFITVYEMYKDTSISGLLKQEPTDDVLNTFYDKTKPLKTISHLPAVHDSAPAIRIPLPLEFGQRFFAATDSLYKPQYFNDSILRGFFFDAAEINNGGSIMQINNGDSTRMVLYYHEDTAQKTFTIDFPSNKAKCNVFHNNFNPGVQTFSENLVPDTNQLDTVFYLKGNYGMGAKIVLKGFQSIAEEEGPIVVNKAFLSLSTADSATYHEGLFTPVNGFYVYVDDDEQPFLSEYITQSGSYDPVYYNSAENKYYDILLSNHIYNLIQEGKDETTLILRPLNNNTEPHRSVIRGFNNPTQELKLYITYTKLN